MTVQPLAGLSLIVAVAANGVIGRDNRMPWSVAADLRHFKAMTMGKPLLMGRKTFQSLKGPLPGRPHVVVSRDPALVLPDGVHRASTLEDGLARAFALSGEAGEVMVIGGAQLYAATLPLAARLYLTEIHGVFEGDTVFPPFDRAAWRETAREEHDGDPAFAFTTLERR
ncbi:MAG: dihydrofolate reductase [Rhodospirillaceae bacterium]|nr:dihydrofolate reductase [Rhodospirillaceae bacterium]